MSKKKKKKRTAQLESVADPQPEKKPEPLSGSLPSPRWLLWAFGAAIAVLACVAYWQGLHNGFTNWDDNWLITDNRFIRGLSWQHIQAMFNPMAPREELGNEYLPLRDLSYAINYAFDQYDPVAYHGTNLLLHVFNSLLVMLFAARLTGRRWIGGVAGVLFAVHPVHVEAVSWLSSRKDLLSTFFMLLSANFYLSARRSRTGLMSSQSFVQRVRESTRLSYILAVLFFMCALMSKMTAVVLPALLLLIELFRGGALHAMPRSRKAIAQAPFWGIAALFTALASHIGSGLMREPYGNGKFQSLLTATSAIARDFQVLFIGWPMHAAVDMPVQTGLSLSVSVGLLLLIGLLAAGWHGWKVANKHGLDSRPHMLVGLVGFGSLWFLIALSPVSNFLVQIGTVFAERYLYIPSIGFCIAVAALVVLGAEMARKHHALRLTLAPAIGAMALAVTVLATWATVEATKPWVGSVSLWKNALRYDPGNHVAHFNLGREYEEQALVEVDDKRRNQLLAQGYDEYQLALDNPARTYRYDPARLYAAMALNQVHREKPERALELLEQAQEHIDLPWRDERARNDIEALIANPRGLALSRLGRHDEAIAAFEEALAKSDRYAGAHLNLCSELSRMALDADPIDEAMLNKARSHLADYERMRGEDGLLIEARARLNLAEFDRRLALSGKGGGKDIPPELQPLLDEARTLYARLVEQRDNGATSNMALAGTMIEAADAFSRGRQGDPSAEKYLRRALVLAPDYLGLRYLIAQFLFEKADLLKQKGEGAVPTLAEATKMLSEELNRHPDYKPALVLKAAGLRQQAVDRAYALKRDWKREYASIKKDDGDPTWEGLITTLKGSKKFREELRVVTTLMREAIEIDPDNEEGHALIAGSGIQIAQGMWWTFDDQLRADAEELLRIAFNARPVDGEVAAKLTGFYLELAEELIRKPKTEVPEEERRAALDDLLKNMLTLSERARNILSRKLFRIADKVAKDEMKLRDEDGKFMELSEGARKLAASEFMRAASVLNPDNVEALDWLKSFYKEQGNFDEALKAFRKLIDALKDRPELMHGVYLSLGQLQLDFGQDLLTRYKEKLRRDQKEEAKQLRDQAVQAYLDALETTGILLNEPENPEKLNLPIRMRGTAAQRLAYLLINDAEKYYTVALDAYALAPLDFANEIAEVREKRAWFVRNAAERKHELEEIRADKLKADPKADVGDLTQQIIELERRIAKEDAEDLVRQGRLDDAMKRLDDAFRAPTPALFSVRGEIYVAMGKQQQDTDERDAFMVKAAKDFVRSSTDPVALIKGADLYWSDEGLKFEEDRIVRARNAYTQAVSVIDSAQITMDESTPEFQRYTSLRKHARDALNDMAGLAVGYLAGARRLKGDAKFEEALEYVDRAMELQGAQMRTYQLKADILLELAKARADRQDEYFALARDVYSSALRLDGLLTGQRVLLMIDMASLLLDHLDDRRGAKEWAARAGDQLRAVEKDGIPEGEAKYMGEEEKRQYLAALDLYRSRLASLDARLK
ncbi:MAG: hypothetical protein H6839_15285 [Planctomycetes bacterium]|nr:hypothetical protein [Planctomycetota bacterium]